MKSSQSVVGVFTLIALAVVSIGCGGKPDPVEVDKEKPAGGPGASPEVAIIPSPESGGTTGGARTAKEKAVEPDPEPTTGAASGQGDVEPLPKLSAVPRMEKSAGAVSGSEPEPDPGSSSPVGEKDAGDIGSESNTDADSAIARARLRAKQKKELQVLIGLGKAFRVWSLDEDGAYPPAVDHPEFVEELGRPDLLKFKNATTGEVARPWYMKGVTTRTSAVEILLASPWVYNGKRAVIYCDSSGDAIPEEEFQAKVAKAIAKGGRELVK